MALLGNPFVANVPRQMSNEELTQALRVDIAGELEAIIGYEAHVMATNDARVQKVLRHIADEEMCLPTRRISCDSGPNLIARFHSTAKESPCWWEISSVPTAATG